MAKSTLPRPSEWAKSGARMSGIVWFVIVIASGWVVVHLATYAWRASVVRSLRSCDRPEALPWFDRARAFLFEVLAAAVARLSIPLDWIPQPITDRRPPITNRQSPGTVVLIHDFGVNGASLWLLARRLRRIGWQTAIMRHAALRTDAHALAAELRTLVDAAAASDTKQIVLVGHGFGGMIARLYGRDYGPLQVRRIVTLGTAHRGSVLSSLHGPMRAILQPRGRLVAYVEASDPVPHQFDVITLFSTFDAWVLPAANAEYPGAFNIQVNDVGHDAMLLSTKVFQLVQENLAVPIKE